MHDDSCFNDVREGCSTIETVYNGPLVPAVRFGHAGITSWLHIEQHRTDDN